MQRWNEERALMQRRWDRETEHHRPTWYDELYCIEPDDCACLRGIGYFRKIRREGHERGSNWRQWTQRADRRAERYEAAAMIREQMVEGGIDRHVGRERVGFRLDWLD